MVCASSQCGATFVLESAGKARLQELAEAACGSCEAVDCPAIQVFAECDAQTNHCAFTGEAPEICSQRFDEDIRRLEEYRACESDFDCVSGQVPLNAFCRNPCGDSYNRSLAGSGELDDLLASAEKFSADPECPPCPQVDCRMTEPQCDILAEKCMRAEPTSRKCRVEASVDEDSCRIQLEACDDDQVRRIECLEVSEGVECSCDFGDHKGVLQFAELAPLSLGEPIASAERYGDAAYCSIPEATAHALQKCGFNAVTLTNEL